MKGEIQYTDDGMLICEICGEAYHKLGSHVFMTHKMRANEYKKKFGLNIGQGLISEVSRKLAQARNYENRDLVVGENLKKAGEATRFKKGSKGRTREKVSVQCYNKLKQNFKNFGMSYEEFIEAGRKLGESGLGNKARWAVRKDIVAKIMEAMRKENIDADLASPNFVNDFAHNHNVTNLRSEEVVFISDNYKGGTNVK